MTALLFIRRLGALTMMCGILGAPVLADAFYDNIFPVPRRRRTCLPTRSSRFSYSGSWDSWR
ncbi:hypothetical protein SBI67_18820 [Mycolicibacterium sp. 120266]|uniref:hypothetical protein n=1 Tax=Mycolicibacterium sp. 120266 TaxID=3090601 RepID=UPI00299EAC5C|nr:hypothetical protein [Mycolicibacterium sp. 120266]MDX1874176.1 hypothetical protein [Mycolicibacterium sp. 120266]